MDHRATRRGLYTLPLVEKEMHVYGSGSSYYRDMEELVRLLIGRITPRIDDSAIITGNRMYDDREASYKNRSEFILDSF
jgi:hypothetical protein